MISLLKSIHARLLNNLETIWSRLSLYLKENLQLICTLSILMLGAYGFELFNFNLTVDEEVHATYFGPALAWIQQGRWGIYVLNALIMPKTVIPFIPLFVALVFQMGAILLLLEVWNIHSKIERFIVGALYIIFPIMAYVYTFSTFNYAIGIGLFCISLGMFFFVKQGWKKWLAILPIAFALSIYQGFLPVILGVFLMYLLIVLLRDRAFLIKDIPIFVAVFLAAYIVYELILQVILFFLNMKVDPYIAGQFNVDFFLRDPFGVLSLVYHYLLLPVYSGAQTIYTINIWIMGILLLISAASLLLSLSKLTPLNGVLGLLLVSGLLFLPFASGLLMGGQMSIRFMLAVPLVFSGSVLLGMMERSRSYKIFILILTGACVYYFMISNNQLFASSYLALQADRSLATRLIDAIETARVDADVQELRYIEVVGYYERPSQPFMPELETFGTSFFTWGFGSPVRVADFLRIMGYPTLKPLNDQGRAKLIPVVEKMPTWPATGSVKIVDDIVVIRFGPYSMIQRQDICTVIAQSDPAFCAAP